jgi:hypothetical protein
MKLRAGLAFRIAGVIFFKLKMLLADRALFAAMLVFHVVFSLISGYTVKSEATGVPAIALVDEDKSMISEKFTRMLTAHAGIRVEPLDREEAHKKLDTHKIEGVFVLTDGFGQKIESGDMDSLFEYTMLPSSYLEGYFLELVSGAAITMAARTMSIERSADTFENAGLEIPDHLREAAGAYFDSHWDEGPPMKIVYSEVLEGRETESPTATLPVAQTVAVGMFLVFSMFYVLAGSGWLIEEKENNTLTRLRSMPGGLPLSYWGGVASSVAAMFNKVPTSASIFIPSISSSRTRSARPILSALIRRYLSMRIAGTPRNRSSLSLMYLPANTGTPSRLIDISESTLFCCRSILLSATKLNLLIKSRYWPIPNGSSVPSCLIFKKTSVFMRDGSLIYGSFCWYILL